MNALNNSLTQYINLISLSDFKIIFLSNLVSLQGHIPLILYTFG